MACSPKRPMIRDPADRISALRFLAAFSAALLAAFALDGAAAPFVVRLGPDRVVLDAPPGFSDSLGLGSPRLQELAESLTSASNKILLFALTDADLRRFMGGDRPDFRRYLLVAVPARLEHERVGLGQFADLASEARREMGALPENADVLPYLDTRPRGKPQLLAELRSGPLILSVLRGMRLPSKDDADDDRKAQYAFSTTTLLLVRGKALTLSVYTGYDGPADIEWLRGATAAWVDELLRLNRNP